MPDWNEVLDVERAVRHLCRVRWPETVFTDFLGIASSKTHTSCLRVRFLDRGPDGAEWVRSYTIPLQAIEYLLQPEEQIPLLLAQKDLLLPKGLEVARRHLLTKRLDGELHPIDLDFCTFT